MVSATVDVDGRVRVRVRVGYDGDDDVRVAGAGRGGMGRWCGCVRWCDACGTVRVRCNGDDGCYVWVRVTTMGQRG